MLINNDPYAEEQLQDELASAERLLWAGRPCGRIILRKLDIIQIPLSIAFGSFAFIGESMAIREDGKLSIILGLILILYGLYCMVGRFFYAILLKNKTVYGVTTNRVIIKSDVFKRTVYSYKIKSLKKLKIQERADGSGDIKIHPNNAFSTSFAIKFFSSTVPMPQIELIPNVRGVYELIVQQQKLKSNV